MSEPFTFDELKRLHDLVTAAQYDQLDRITLTRAQQLWLRRKLDTPHKPLTQHLHLPPSGDHALGTAVVLVDRVEDSTPYQRGWTGFPGVAEALLMTDVPAYCPTCRSRDRMVRPMRVELGGRPCVDRWHAEAVADGA